MVHCRLDQGPLLVALLSLLVGCSSPVVPVVPLAPNETKVLASFSLGQGEVVEIQQKSRQVMVFLESAVPRPLLVAATFQADAKAVLVGTAAQVSGVTVNDFSRPVVLSLVATDGTAENYTVNVRAISRQSVDLSPPVRYLRLPQTGVRYELSVAMGDQARPLSLVFTNTSSTAASTLMPAVGMAAKNAELASAWSRGLIVSSEPGSRSLRATQSVGVEHSSTFVYKDLQSNNWVRPVPTTLRRLVNDPRPQGRTLFVWVADDCWGTASEKRHQVDQAMVDALADRFLKEGDNNDLYDWVTNLYDREYYDKGTAVPSGLIEATNEIHIVIEDIDDDNLDLGVMGYYYAANSFLKTSTAPGASGSNERVLFAIDGVMLARDEKGAQDAASVLAHEFQHMIRFYQKTLLRGLESPTWIDEMTSMVTEDLVADKLGVPGPRGVVQVKGSAYDYGTGTLETNDMLRLGRFNLGYASVPLVGWAPEKLLYSYGTAYSFGGWLARNYGGAPLFRQIVTNDKVAVDSILQAIETQTGQIATFRDLVEAWSLAVYLSPGETVSPWLTQTATPFASTLNSEVYRLGSIDYQLYKPVGASFRGPQVYTSLSGLGSSLTALPAGASYYYRVSSAVIGNIQYTIDLPPDVSVALVAQ